MMASADTLLVADFDVATALTAFQSLANSLSAQGLEALRDDVEMQNPGQEIAYSMLPSCCRSSLALRNQSGSTSWAAA